MIFFVNKRSISQQLGGRLCGPAGVMSERVGPSLRWSERAGREHGAMPRRWRHPEISSISRF